MHSRSDDWALLVMGSRQVYRWYVETDQFVTNAVQHAYTLSAFADDSQVSTPNGRGQAAAMHLTLQDPRQTGELDCLFARPAGAERAVI